MTLKQLENGSFEISFENDQEKVNFLNYFIPKKTLRAKEVMEILGITRVTLCHYVKRGLIKVTKPFETGQYQYDYDSVMAIKNGKSK